MRYICISDGVIFGSLDESQTGSVNDDNDKDFTKRVKY